MTCRFLVWPVLLQADLFHTTTWVSLRDTRRAFLCFRFLESEARSCSEQVMMTPWLHCGLLPASQKVSWWARVKYHAWGPAHNMGNCFPVVFPFTTAQKQSWLSELRAHCLASLTLSLITAREGQSSSDWFVQEERNQIGNSLREFPTPEELSK